MTRIAWIAALAIGLTLAPSLQSQDAWRDACIQRCVSQAALGDPEMQTQEIISLEKEAARAIQLSNGTFFYRVYSDDFSGTLSHGQLINKAQWIATIESPSFKRESFNASDIKVRIFEQTAIATCLWSARFIANGQHVSSQIRTLHVYIDTPHGWHVIAGQTTTLPPDVQQPL
jgi:hypothetical protein